MRPYLHWFALGALATYLCGCAEQAPEWAERVQQETLLRVDVHHANLFKPLRDSVVVPLGKRVVGNCGDFAKTAQSMVKDAILWPCTTDRGVSHVVATDFVWAWDARFKHAVTFIDATKTCK